MNSSAFSTPARRTAAALSTAAIALGPVLFGAAPANAAPRDGKAGAVVLRANLKVKALNVAEVPLNLVLNDVDAPKNENEKLLDAKVKGINGGQSFNMIKAQVATADAKVNKRRAVGEAKLANATVRLPGLNVGDPLVRVELATAKATCVAGAKPRAHSKVVGLTVLGKPVKGDLHGTRTVPVTGVGRVTLGLAETRTTERNAIATAVRLNVTVHTLAQTKVKGSVILSQATCRAPLADEGDTTGGNTTGGETDGGNTDGGQTDGGQTDGGATEGNTDGGQTDGGTTEGDDNGGNTEGTTTGTAGGDTAGDDGGASTGGGGLAETGSSSSTPYLAAGAGVLMVAGAGALVLTRRRRAATAQQD
ncbi:choice-of-anchor P family protein [Streptomyces meridianus]|uniref:LPXTG cell wall anchor domain-containing protein n=1 Tax=Streptomyces meridianus TaxID=2938945 RepID=A0ABT0X4R7_9ACTN|nr:choice-of-anchor P family protein [Streptomyces meridianus]MCM2577539.1 LPXTG cell wall anchor domain-containing protein [Streptomyces meridianus]